MSRAACSVLMNGRRSPLSRWQLSANSREPAMSASRSAASSGVGSSAARRSREASSRHAMGVLAPTPRGSNPIRSKRASTSSEKMLALPCTRSMPDAPGPPGLTSRDPIRDAGSLAGSRTSAISIVSGPGLISSSGTRSVAHSNEKSHSCQTRAATGPPVGATVGALLAGGAVAAVEVPGPAVAPEEVVGASRLGRARNGRRGSPARRGRGARDRDRRCGRRRRRRGTARGDDSRRWRRSAAAGAWRESRCPPRITDAPGRRGRRSYPVPAPASSEPRAQPLTPPTASPPTMYRWNTRYTTETGSANRIANAAKSDHGVVVANWPTIALSAIDSVKSGGSVEEHPGEVELGPAGDEAEERGDREGRGRERQDDLEEHLVPRRAVDGGRLLEFARDRVEVALEVPDREGQRAGDDRERHAGDRVAQDEVAEPDRVELDVQRGQGGDRRQHQDGENRRASGPSGRGTAGARGRRPR